MAFVRWRGQTAQLLATVYDQGRSKKITLANLPGFYVHESTKLNVAERFPKIKVDWLAVDRALATGPLGILEKDPPPEHLDWATVEHFLRKWGAEAEHGEAKLIREANTLYRAAEVLTKWRSDFYFINPPSKCRINTGITPS